MAVTINPFVTLLFAGALVAAIDALLAWRMRTAPGGRSLALLMVAVAEWSLAAGMEALGGSIPVKAFWSAVSYIGVMSCGPLLVLFSLEFAGLDDWLTPRRLAALWAFPVLTVLAAFTNSWHLLLWPAITAGPAGLSGVPALYQHGPWLWLQASYSYILIGFSCGVLVWAAFRRRKVFRQQALIMLAGVLIGVSPNLFYLIGMTPSGYDYSPVSFAAAGVLILWNMRRYRLLDLTPVARDALIDQIGDGVLALDGQQRIVDANPAARAWLGGGDLLGSSLVGAAGHWPELVALCRAAVGRPGETYAELPAPNDLFRTLEGRAWSLHDQQGDYSGLLVYWHDITRRKQAEAAERRERLLAEALASVTAALTSTLNLDEVLERILHSVGEVVPHDAANIALLDGQGGVQSLRGSGQGAFFAALPAEAQVYQRMISARRAVVIPSVHGDARWTEVPGLEWVCSFAGAPILIKGRVLGFLSLYSRQEDFFPLQQVQALQAFADQAAIAIENARLYGEVQRLAIVDELTGVYNYRGLVLLGPREVERARRFYRPLSAMFFDIDHFRDFNNHYSHAVGNLVLRAVAQEAQVRLRRVDLLARFGGEEFVALLPEAALDEARLIAGRLRQAVEVLKVPTDYGDLGVTVSIGLAELSENDADLEALLDSANAAERLAKQNGRNRVEG